MKEIFKELDSGKIGMSVLIETEKVPEFLLYSMSRPKLYSYRLEYFEKLTKITLTDINTIIKSDE